MTRKYTDQTLEHLSDHDSGRLYEDVLLERCVLRNASMLMNEVTRRTRIRQVTLHQCTIYTNCLLGPAIIEEALLEDCPKPKSSRGFVPVEGAALRHVTLRGKIVPFYILHNVRKSDPTRRTLIPAPEFTEDNVRFYRDVDWALDITEAEFDECGLRGVPGHLVRFDPRTAALVRRVRAMERLARLKELGAAVPFTFAVGDMLRGPYDSVVVVASLLAPKKRRQEELDALQRLRDEGIADPA